MSTTPEEIRIPLKHITLAGQRWGDPNAFPLIALHGWLDNSNSFKYIAQNIDADSKICLWALDWPGHGRSAHRSPATSYEILEYVGDLYQFVQHQKFERFGILGHSLGGVVASLFGGIADQSLLGMVLIDALGPLANKEEETPRQLQKALHKRFVEGSREAAVYPTVDAAVAARHNGFGQLADDAVRILVERNLRDCAEGYTWRTDPRIRQPSMLRLSENQVASFLRNIQCPTRLIVPSKGFVPVDPDKNPRLGLIKSLDRVQVEGGHHLHMEEAANEVWDVTRAFFEGILDNQ